MLQIGQARLNELASGVGLMIIGSAGANFAEDQAVQALTSWQQAGFAGDMGYMLREPRSYITAQRLLPEVISIIAVAISYCCSPHAPLPRGFGRVARYAWGRDYHTVLKRKLSQLVAVVEGELGQQVVSRVFSDAVPLLERELTRAAGLAFIGKNCMAIRPGLGSFFLIAELCWNVGIDRSDTIDAFRGCGSCSRCLRACPTGALVAEGVLDARRCISYLTIEKRGILTWEEREAVGEWLFGCDLCQDPCPFNSYRMQRCSEPDLPALAAASGPGAYLELLPLLDIRSDAGFAARFGGTALMRTKRVGLLRNALMVIANQLFEQGYECVVNVSRNDPSPVIRLHALWTLYKIGSECNMSRTTMVAAIEPAVVDCDDAVVAEALNILDRI